MATVLMVNECKDGGLSSINVNDVFGVAATAATAARPKSEVANGKDGQIEITPAERNVQKYLASFLEAPRGERVSSPPRGVGRGASFGRQRCCNSSQSLYCKECLRLLVPERALPVPVSRRRAAPSENGQSETHGHGRCPNAERRPLRLPFDLQIVLDDRRGSATGLHAVALLDRTRGTEEEGPGPQMDDGRREASGSVTLIDLPNGGKTPRYDREDSTTFLLFPAPDSIPLESVAANVRTLVVLDCKWTKNQRFFRNNPGLSALRKVHLSRPPRESYYWRWHNAGPGMISTIEAIYYAALEVAQEKCRHRLESNQTTRTNLDDCRIDWDNLIHLLWLFGHQRAATFNQDDGTPIPCTEEGKEYQRSLKKQKGTWRQLRHEGDALRLRERQREREEKRRKGVQNKERPCAP